MASSPDDVRRLLDDTARRAADYLESLSNRPVARPVDAEGLRARLGGELPEVGAAAADVVRELSEGADEGVVATAGPRYFGFVNGGSLPAALAADWLASAWDQNAAMQVMSPAAGVIEEVVLEWLRDLLGLPAGGSGAFVTGGQMANFVGLAAARHQVLAAVGWDVESKGLIGAPPVTVVVGEEKHAAVGSALRYLGLGADCMIALGADDDGAMDPASLAGTLARAPGPVIVCAQAGNVNTGACDPIGEICAIARERAAWVHVDGAFGLWAAASPRTRHLLDGLEAADSWAVDMHKWLNVPYDCSVALTVHPRAHRAAMSATADYLPPGEHREPIDWNPEMSRRARAIPVWAALRALGRRGVADLVDRCCALARRFAERLAAADGVEVLNEVVLNQVLVRFGDDDAVTREVIGRVQEDGTCWMGGTRWHGRAAMRISVSNWSTREDDVDRSVEALLRAFAAVR